MQLINANYLKLEFVDKVSEKTKVTQEAADNVLTYFKLNNGEWNSQFQNIENDSILLRHGNTGLPFTIEYWKTGELLIHTKENIAPDESKRVTLSIDLLNQQLLVRVKGKNIESSVLESKVIGSFDHPSVVRKLKDSFYSSKLNFEELPFLKHAMIQEYYDGTLLMPFNSPLNSDVIKMIAIELSDAFANVHEKGYAHCDCKLENVFFKKDPKTDQLEKVALGDFDKAIHKSELEDEKKIVRLQNLDVEKLIKNLFELYKTHDLNPPSILSEALTVIELHQLRRQNKTKYDKRIDLLKKIGIIPEHDQSFSAKRLADGLRKIW